MSPAGLPNRKTSKILILSRSVSDAVPEPHPLVPKIRVSHGIVLSRSQSNLRMQTLYVLSIKTLQRKRMVCKIPYVRSGPKTVAPSSYA